MKTDENVSNNIAESQIQDPAITSKQISRRALLSGGALLAGLSVLRVAGPSMAFGQSGETIIPWLDPPPPSPIPTANVGNLLNWEQFDSWLKPAQNFFYVNHY